MSRGAHILSLAARQLTYGDAGAALETVRGLLTEDPSNATAHALLAQILLSQRRLHAADIEARLALQYDPMLPYAHVVLGRVALSQRRFGASEESFLAAHALAPDDAAPFLGRATLRRLQQRRREVAPLLEEALRREPNDAQIHADLAEHYADVGDTGRAYTSARSALALTAECADAHVVLGRLELGDGNVEAAREGACDALRLEPNNAGALRLLAEVKARQSWALGLWWRFSAALDRLGPERSIGVLVGLWFVIQLATTYFKFNKAPTAATVTSWSFLAFCAYTWVAPGLFHRSVQRELGAVKSLKDF